MVRHRDADRIAKATAREAGRLVRDWRILEALRLGAPLGNVATVYGLSAKHVRRIERKHR